MYIQSSIHVIVTGHTVKTKEFSLFLHNRNANSKRKLGK